MNEKTTKQIEEMMNQTIGVEVEMNSITRAKAAQIAAEFFGTRRHENTAGRNGYCTYSAWDGEGREWKFQKDVSIHGPDSEKCELVTPILTYADIETLQELIRRLRKAGAKSDATRGCGVHIHIGAKGHTPQRLEPRQKPHEPLLPHGQQGFPGGTQPQKAENHGGACGHLVQQSECGLRQVGALQREPLPYAEPARNLYKGND